MKLNELSDNAGATKNRMRVGRGIGSGKGKTSGAGQKGQKSRSGVSINGFEGGQMPIYRRLPKRGFTNAVFKGSFAELNLGKLQTAIDAKQVDIKKTITVDTLVEAGVLRRKHDGVRLLGQGELKSKVNIEVAHATASAKAAVEKAGGTVSIAVRLVPVAEDVKPTKAAKSTKSAKGE